MVILKLSKKQKKNKVSVRAPDYIPKRAPVFKDTTGTEALDVFKVANSISRVLSLVMIVIGIFVTTMSAYGILMSGNMFLNPFFVGILGIIGTLNVFSGLLLLAKK
jgi:uncharacterized Tic20 family protein